MYLIDLERLRYPNTGLANVCVSLVDGLKAINKLNDYAFYSKNTALDKLEITNKFPWRIWHQYGCKFKKCSFIHLTHQLSRVYNFYAGPKILTLHDFNFLRTKNRSKHEKIIKIINNNFRGVKYLVCISEFVKQEFIDNRHLFQIPNDLEIRVIPNGLIFNPFDQKSEINELIKFKPKKYLLNIGVLSPHKNQLPILDILDDKKDIHLIQVHTKSKAEYKTKFIQKAKELGVLDRVHFLSNITDEEKNFFLRNCVALLHPSVAEGFGIPPIEAMYCKKPVFVSNSTSLPEICGSYAYYFKNFDRQHVQKIFKEGMMDFDQNKKEKKKKLRCWATQYSHIKMAEKYHYLYQEMIKNHC